MEDQLTIQFIPILGRCRVNSAIVCIWSQDHQEATVSFWEFFVPIWKIEAGLKARFASKKMFKIADFQIKPFGIAIFDQDQPLVIPQFRLNSSMADYLTITWVKCMYIRLLCKFRVLFCLILLWKPLISFKAYYSWFDYDYISFSNGNQDNCASWRPVSCFLRPICRCANLL